MADSTVYFSDFSFDFSAHPKTGDISILKNDDAIRNSIRNLVQLKYGEMLFNSKIGCGINFTLFEFMDEITRYTVQGEITNTLLNYEPRVSVSSIEINEDSLNHGYYISIFYTIVNANNIQSVTVFLERVR